MNESAKTPDVKKKDTEIYPKILIRPIRIFLISIFAIFLAEFAVMYVLSILPLISTYKEAFLDSLLLIMIVFPLIYFIIIRPLRRHITAHQLAEINLRNSEERFRSVAETANDAFISINSAGEISFWNRAAEIIFGYSASEITGKPVTLIMPERFREPHKKGLENIIKTGKSNIIGKRIELFGLKKNGNEFPVGFSVSMWKARGGTFFTAIIRDITERRHMEEKLREFAEIDPLTKTFNRRIFFNFLEAEMNRIKRYNEKLSLIMFDIDRFKDVNDIYGHDTGDYVLSSIADIVKSSIRKADILARYGGEEFMIISSESDIKGIKMLAEKVRTAIEDYNFEKVIKKVTVSIGITVSKDEDTINSLVKRVDEALYLAKNNGRNRVEILT